MPERLVQIGAVADRVGLSLRTVRYYEELGLLVPEARTQGGFRMYSDDQVKRLQLIKRMKPLGFSVQEMGELLHARDTLRDVSAPPAAAEAARETLGSFAKGAAERCEQLRDQLVEAEAFAEQVRRESRRARRSRQPSSSTP
ncbi:MAG: MerR family transcriptional regulator [Solirubrobacteraceae bacterium]|nr:MerR family transcriptional regulator [Solirubrobacteraceae bacterium]